MNTPCPVVHPCGGLSTFLESATLMQHLLLSSAVRVDTAVSIGSWSVVLGLCGPEGVSLHKSHERALVRESQGRSPTIPNETKSPTKAQQTPSFLGIVGPPAPMRCQRASRSLRNCGTADGSCHNTACGKPATLAQSDGVSSPQSRAIRNRNGSAPRSSWGLSLGSGPTAHPKQSWIGSRRVSAAPKNARPSRTRLDGGGGLWWGWMGCAGSRQDGSTGGQSPGTVLTGVRSPASCCHSRVQ